MRKILYCFMSIYLVFATTTAAYAASPSGWSVSSATIAGATATINAVKNGAKATISHRPSAVAIAKELGKGGGALALAYAMSKLLDAGIDWVLDPANNRVKYTEPADDSSGQVAPGEWGWHWLGYDVFYPTAEDACLAGRSSKITFSHLEFDSDTTAGCYATTNDNPERAPRHWFTVQYAQSPAAADGGSGAQDKEKYIPLPDVAAQVASNAEAGHVGSQDFIKGVAVGQANDGELDPALDAAATDTADPADPADPTDPAEPFDPSGIMDLLKRILGALGLLSILATISDTLTSFTDFFKDDPPANEADPVEVDPALVPDKSAADFDVEYINFGGQCPTLPSFDVGIGGASTSMAFDMSPLCDLAVKIRPAIIAIAYFIGLGIIASAIRET